MEIRIESIDRIKEAASDFLSQFASNRYFAFYGEMGSGKTTFISALCEELKAADDINSPTFSIVNEYYSEQNGMIYHFDFYRINKIEEVFDIGFDDYIQNCDYCFIEWPELIEPILPDDFVKIKIEEQSDQVRKLTLM